MTRLAALLPLLAAASACKAASGTVLLVRAPKSEDSGVISEPGAGPPDAGEPDAAAAHDSGTSSEVDASAPDTRGVCRIGGASDGFYENFNGSALDPSHWLVADGPYSFGGSSPRGGFARENVEVRGGSLRLIVRGDRSTSSAKRSAAAIATRDLFGSGTYQVQGSVSGPASLELALWFVRDDDHQGGIDLTAPGTNAGARDYGFVRMRTRDASSANDVQFELGQRLDDGASHILRFDWYTTASKSVSFWIDDQLRAKSQRALPPTAAGRLWIVAWVRDDAPADFDSAEIRLDNAFVTPFGNDGDVCTDGELRGPSLTLP